MATIDEIVQLVVDLLQDPILVKYGLAGLFLNGVLASTALPIPTEITVAALIGGGHDKLLIFAVLATSSTLGGFIGYWLGRSGTKLFRFLKHKPKKESSNEESKSNNLLRKYGWIAIVGAAWIPIVGDFIPIVAGTKRYDLKKFSIALAIGKSTKAVAVVYLSSFIVGQLLGG